MLTVSSCFLVISIPTALILFPEQRYASTLPEKIEFEVIDTTEAVKGNTTNNALKDATIETGYTVKVPLFINQGEHIIISTIDGKYSSRA